MEIKSEDWSHHYRNIGSLRSFSILIIDEPTIRTLQQTLGFIEHVPNCRPAPSSFVKKPRTAFE